MSSHLYQQIIFKLLHFSTPQQFSMIRCMDTKMLLVRVIKWHCTRFKGQWLKLHIPKDFVEILQDPENSLKSWSSPHIDLLQKSKVLFQILNPSSKSLKTRTWEVLKKQAWQIVKSWKIRLLFIWPSSYKAKNLRTLYPGGNGTVNS